MRTTFFGWRKENDHRIDSNTVKLSQPIILYRKIWTIFAANKMIALRLVPTTVPPAQNYQNTRISHLCPDFFFLLIFCFVVTILFL